MNYYIRILIVVIAGVIYSSFAWPGEFSLVPSVSFREEYNNNILFSTNDQKEDFLTTISPGIEMVNRTERFDVDMSARWDWMKYTDNGDADGISQTYNGRFSYRITPLFNVSANAGYARNLNPTLNINSIGYVMAAVPWDHFTSSLSADYSVTEKTTANLTYTYGRDYYEKPGYVDDVSHDVNLGFIYDLGKYFSTMKLLINGGYSDYQFSDTRIDEVMGTVGFSRNINERWNILIYGGACRLWSEFSVTQLQFTWTPPFWVTVKIPQTNDGWNWLGKISLAYKGEYANGELSYLRDFTPAYGLNGAGERNTFTFSAQYKFTKEFSVLLAAGYYTLKSDALEYSMQAIDQRTVRVSPGVRYEFSKDIYLEASYEYINADYPLQNTEAKRDDVSICLYIQHPFFSRTK